MSDSKSNKIKFKKLIEYESVLSRFELDLNIARETIEFFPNVEKIYVEKLEKEIKQNTEKLTSEDIEQIKDANEIIANQTKGNTKWPLSISGKLIFSQKNAGITFSKILDSVQLKRQMSDYIHDTSLVYLISVFEVFLKDCIKLVFNNEPRMLKTPREMTHKEILESETIQELKNKILEKEVKLVIDKDIDRMGKILADDFKLHLIQKENWSDFTERFYRRNVIVHNNSIPDEKYHKLTGSDAQILKTDQDYILKSIDLFKEYAEDIAKSFKKHFSSQQKI